MIEEQVKQHDKFSLEMKIGFLVPKRQKPADSSLNIWMFVPNSLDINRFTYTKADFYRDLQSHIRLITPIFLLNNIAESNFSPLVHLKQAFHKLASKKPSEADRRDYEYQIKMFLSILKSSLREEIHHILNHNQADKDKLVNEYCGDIRMVATKYRELFEIINIESINSQYIDYYRFGDEFMSNLIEFHAFHLMQSLKETSTTSYISAKNSLLHIIDAEIAHKKAMGYLLVDKSEGNTNQFMVLRLGLLKKFAESHLYLNINKRKDGRLVEQLLYSLAAGISMVFATVIAFSFQKRFGSYTMPLLVALVVSYMLKDRIKEFTRYYFAHKMGSHFFDHKIMMNISLNDIGWSKESMDFISETKVPVEIMKARGRTSLIEANNRADAEQVMLYRTRMHIDRKKLDLISKYAIAGVNTILRLNVSAFIRNMDNAEFPLYYPDDSEGFQIIQGERLYFLNLVVHKQSGLQNELEHYRIAMNRNGIQKIEKL